MENGWFVKRNWLWQYSQQPRARLITMRFCWAVTRLLDNGWHLYPQVFHQGGQRSLAQAGQLSQVLKTMHI